MKFKIRASNAQTLSYNSFSARSVEEMTYITRRRTHFSF